MVPALLSPAVTNLRLGVVDDSQSAESRELVAVLSESKSFRVAGAYRSVERLGDAIARGDLDAGLVVPADFAKNLERGRPSSVQVLLNAMNANTAAISQGYMRGVIENYARELSARNIHAGRREIPSAPPTAEQVVLYPTFLYNPGLVTSWFVVTGLFGMLLIMIGSVTASTNSPTNASSPPVTRISTKPMPPLLAKKALGVGYGPRTIPSS